MEFRILGPLEVHGESGAVALVAIKPRAVLAVLLLHANEPVSAERLALALWGEDAPAGATKTVHVYVSRLRKAVGDPAVIETTPAGYRLRVRARELDAERFARGVEAGRRALAAGRPEQGGRLLREALGLWRGPPLAELEFEPFAQAEIARLQELRLEALEARVEADLAMGRHAALIGELQGLLAEHPTRERFAADLMLALYRSGRQAEALEVYHDARRVLVEQVGVEPGPELQRVQQAVLNHDASLELPFAPHRRAHGSTAGLEPAAAPTSPPPVEPRIEPRSAALPTWPTSFVGRTRELAEIERLVADPHVRLLTLTGPGGAGKTRLALEAAKRIRARFRDGVVFVDLSPVRDPELVTAAIAESAGLTEVRGAAAKDELATHLQS